MPVSTRTKRRRLGRPQKHRTRPSCFAATTPAACHNSCLPAVPKPCCRRCPSGARRFESGRHRKHSPLRSLAASLGSRRSSAPTADRATVAVAMPRACERSARLACGEASGWASDRRPRDSLASCRLRGSRGGGAFGPVASVFSSARGSSCVRCEGAKPSLSLRKLPNMKLRRRDQPLRFPANLIRWQQGLIDAQTLPQRSVEAMGSP